MKPFVAFCGVLMGVVNWVLLMENWPQNIGNNWSIGAENWFNFVFDVQLWS